MQRYPDNPKPKTKGLCKTIENYSFLVVGGKIKPKVERLKSQDEVAIQIDLFEKGHIVVCYTASDSFKQEMRNQPSTTPTIFRGDEDCKVQNINHAVLKVVYGVQRGSGGKDVKYWKVLNSWSTQRG